MRQRCQSGQHCPRMGRGGCIGNRHRKSSVFSPRMHAKNRTKIKTSYPRIKSTTEQKDACIHGFSHESESPLENDHNSASFNDV
ncbi:hypothetical protein Hanom_Chr04g00384531 [Helianthus anomalus]